MKSLFSVFLVFALIVISGCSASTGTRYDEGESSAKNDKSKKEVEENVKNEAVNTNNIVEDFDITPFKSRIKVDIQNNSPGFVPPDVWYGYENENVNKSKNIIGTTDGYRVQVISTDNLEKANNVRSEIYLNTQNKEVYINFEPPFYKVKVGDFTDREDADNLKFKLNQLGYSEARVVQETINLFSE